MYKIIFRTSGAEDSKSERPALAPKPAIRYEYYTEFNPKKYNNKKVYRFPFRDAKNYCCMF